MFARRRVIQQRKQPTPPTTKSCVSPLKLITLALILILCSLSVYLSTTISTTTPHTQDTPNTITLAHNNKHLPMPKTTPTLSPNLQTSLDKSLKLYLLRPGHTDRIEYMIGFNSDRINNPSQYTTLTPRDQTKKYNRDYTAQPIAIGGWQSQPDTEHKCDALCTHCRGDCDVAGVKWSMENVQITDGTPNNQITGSTRMDSLVPVPYFSYYDFGFMTPVISVKDKSKNRLGLAAAFISNCGFPKRNNMVRDLQKYGVKVDSYGRCEHNSDERRGDKGREQTKVELLSKYKFSLAFENSETDDYISEKLFGTLVSGSIPVYIGAPNIKFFAPDAGEYIGPGKPWKSHSVIWAGDYGFDAQRLAQYLLYLDGNDTAYDEYVKWKWEGVSGDFKALIELTSATHTSCRQCILGMDWTRYKQGCTEYDKAVKVIDYGNEGLDRKWFYVRERGMYRFVLIRVEQNTLEALVKNILQSLEPKPVNQWKNNEHPNRDRIGPALYAIYHVPTKHVINSDEAIQNLQDYVELEVIFV